jgi:hypothetical protein
MAQPFRATGSASSQATSSPDIDQLAEKVLRLLEAELRLDRSRHGEIILRRG